MTSAVSAKRLRSSTALAFGSRAFGTATRFALQVVLARWLGTSSYGRFVVVRGWGELLAKVPNGGLELAAVRNLPVENVVRSRSYVLASVAKSERLTILRGIVLAAAAVVVASFVGAPSQIWFVGMLLIVAQAIASLYLAMQQAFHRFVNGTVITELCQPLVFGSGIVVLAAADALSATTALVALVGSVAVGALLQRRDVRRSVAAGAQTAERPADIDVERVTETTTAETRLLFASQIAIAAINLSGVLIVGLVVGVEAAGLLAVAGRAASPSRLATSAVESLVSGNLSATRVLDGEGARQARQTIVDNAIRMSFLPSVVFLVGGIVFSGLVLELFGPDYAAARTAVIIFLVAHLVEGMTGPCGYLSSSCGSVVTYARIMSSHAIVMVLLVALFASAWGITGAAIAQLLVTISWNAALVIDSGRSLGVWCLPHRGLMRS